MQIEKPKLGHSMCWIDLTHLGPASDPGRPQVWWRELFTPRTTSEERCAREKSVGFVQRAQASVAFIC